MLKEYLQEKKKEYFLLGLKSQVRIKRCENCSQCRYMYTCVYVCVYCQVIMQKENVVVILYESLWNDFATCL